MTRIAIPAAFFEFEITNTTAEAIDYTLAGTLGNPLPVNNIHTVVQRDGSTALVLTSDAYPTGDVQYGNLTIATDAHETSFQQYWFRGQWFDLLEIFWHDLTTPGKFKNCSFPPERPGSKDQGTLAAHIHLDAGQTQTLRFVISWSFPNCQNYWNPDLSRVAIETGIEPIGKTIMQDGGTTHWTVPDIRYTIGRG